MNSISNTSLIKMLVEIEDGHGPRTHMIENAVSWGKAEGYVTIRLREPDGDRLLWFPEDKIIRLETPWHEIEDDDQGIRA